MRDNEGDLLTSVPCVSEGAYDAAAFDGYGWWKTAQSRIKSFQVEVRRRTAR